MSWAAYRIVRDREDEGFPVSFNNDKTKFKTGENQVTLSISRIYAVDGVETCILAQGPQEDAQGLLRAVERAAEAIGAAPGPLAFSGATPPKTTRKKKGDEAAATAKDEAAPALPLGVSEAFPAQPSLPLGGQDIASRVGSAPELPLSPPPGLAGGPYVVAPNTVVWDDKAPPAQFGSHVGLAPPMGAPAPSVPSAPPPPVFAPPTPAADPHAGLRKQLHEVQASILGVVGAKQPGWLDSVGASLNAIVASNGGDVRTMSEDQLAAALGQIRFYEDTIRRSPGIA